MQDVVIKDADTHKARFVAARWWWKACNKLSRVGCWIRGYHLRRDGKFKHYCLQCCLLDDLWRIEGRTDVARPVEASLPADPTPSAKTAAGETEG